MNRASGILLHISSLPTKYGIGTLGKEARGFIDFLAKAGQSYWQILPIGPTSVGDSPYQSCSFYAGNPYFIDLETLQAEGLLEEAHFADSFFGYDPGRVDYGAQYYYRYPILEKAYDRGRELRRAEFRAFREANPWVEDYAMFMALKRKFGMLPWSQWPKAAAFRDPAALERYREELKHDIGFFAFLQYLFFDQWGKLRDYAKQKEIKLIGDLPIYVPYDSVDVWMYPELFQLDEMRTPTGVAGCPPDAFTEDGQLWGNALYDWPMHEQTGFAWWKERVSASAKCFDVIRIDHFRGLESYWNVPYGDETAKNGKWVIGPGIKFVNAVKEACPDTEFIAEDLGYLTPEVLELQEASGWPGMKILEFSFDDPDNRYLPHNINANCICYTGTHDNVTLKQWWEGAPEEERQFAIDYFGLNEREGLLRGILRGGMGSVAKLFVAQMQDWLEIGAEGRMNEPGIVQPENWSWRLTELPSDELAEEIRTMTRRYSRCAPAPKEEPEAPEEE